MPRSTLTLLTVLAASLVFSRNGESQRIETVSAGDRVRVTTSAGRPRTAVLMALYPDSVVVRTTQEAVRVFRPADGITLEVSRGRSQGRGAIEGAVLGLIAGAIVGALVGQTFPDGTEPDGYASAVLGLYGAGLGVVAGTIVGMHRGTERWARVNWPVSATSPN